MNFSDDFLAHLYLHNCGLSRQEQKEVFDKADRQWDSEKIKQAILDLFDAAHELDEARVLRGRQHQRDPKNTYCVVHNDSAGIEGTDLTPDLVEEPDVFEQIPQAETVFYPASTSTAYLVDQQQITSYGTDYGNGTNGYVNGYGGGYGNSGNGYHQAIGYEGYGEDGYGHHHQHEQGEDWNSGEWTNYEELWDDSGTPYKIFYTNTNLDEEGDWSEGYDTEEDEDDSDQEEEEEDFLDQAIGETYLQAYHQALADN
jgi:hypothetical protein